VLQVGVSSHVVTIVTCVIVDDRGAIEMSWLDVEPAQLAEPMVTLVTIYTHSMARSGQGDKW